ncbi:MAG: hypothetical protein J7498_13300 [Sphingobium sp.]|nr:hypothetical protein [Sphingobium sp.]
MAEAVNRLTDLGSAGVIEIRGRYFRDVLDDEIEIFTEQILPVRLADYRWFDTLDDSLHRGVGLAWDHTRRDLCYPSDDRHYRFVTVNRVDLLREFPPSSVARTPTTISAEIECEKWLLEAFCSDAEKRRAKQSFRDAAITVCEGRLSLRGFDRVWAKVAPQVGRSLAGAKSKR